jgi:hypothetical protein
MTMRKDILVGSRKLSVDLEAVRPFPYYSCVWLIILHLELDLVFNSADARDGHPKPTTLFLMITVSPNAASSSNIVVETLNPTTADLDGSVAQGGAPSLTVPFDTTISPLSRKGDSPTESDDPVRSARDSQTETSGTALRCAEESISKLVIDTVGPIAAVCLISPLHIRQADFRFTAQSLCKCSVESGLKNSRPRSTPPCLSRAHV